MTDLTNEVVEMLAQLRDISGRLARFEHVPQEELDAFVARKRDVIARIEAAEPTCEHGMVLAPAGPGCLRCQDPSP